MYTAIYGRILLWACEEPILLITIVCVCDAFIVYSVPVFPLPPEELPTLLVEILLTIPLLSRSTDFEINVPERFFVFILPVWL